MDRATMILWMWVVGLALPGFSHATEIHVETPHLIVSDATGELTDEKLKRFAQNAQHVLNEVLQFWSANPRTGHLGKIRIIFDQPRREVNSSVFYWDKKAGQRIRVVRVLGFNGGPQMLAHKLTSAVFPQKDKLIRNMMGILSETQAGNPLTFPMCGFDSDEWVLVFIQMNSRIPLNKLGPDHKSWGMHDLGGGKLSIFDKAKQHKAYAETGSFGNYLFQTYGTNRIKRFHKLSHKKDRPWNEVFGVSMQELEIGWLETLKASKSTGNEGASRILKLVERNPDMACAVAQKLSLGNL